MSKRWLIIGGSSGISKALVESLPREDEALLLCRRLPQIDQGSTPTDSTQAQKGVAFSHIPFDIASQTPAFPEILGQVDTLVYCPGNITLKPAKRLSSETIRSDFELNALGAFQTFQKYTPNLLESPSASVIFFSSVAAQVGMPFHVSTAMAKAALEGLTRSLAAEYASKIRVNAIAPTLVDTPLAERFLSSDTKRDAMSERHPLKRIVSPAEAASMVSFLASGASVSISGHILPLDSGLASIRS